MYVWSGLRILVQIWAVERIVNTILKKKRENREYKPEKAEKVYYLALNFSLFWSQVEYKPFRSSYIMYMMLGSSWLGHEWNEDVSFTHFFIFPWFYKHNCA
jgi:hypothetical protein